MPYSRAPQKGGRSTHLTRDFLPALDLPADRRAYRGQVIRQAPSKGLGSEQIPRHRIRPPVPSSVTEEVAFFYSLHYSGKKRFIGYRIGQIFYILWVDHTFQVYDHG
jgi:hypothetical protein